MSLCWPSSSDSLHTVFLWLARWKRRLHAPLGALASRGLLQVSPSLPETVEHAMSMAFMAFMALSGVSGAPGSAPS